MTPLMTDGFSFADSVVRDLHTARRSLMSRRAFAFTVVITLALAIGANTVIFSAVEAVLLRPLPVSGLDRIVDIGHALSPSSTKRPFR